MRMKKYYETVLSMLSARSSYKLYQTLTERIIYVCKQVLTALLGFYFITKICVPSTLMILGSL